MAAIFGRSRQARLVRDCWASLARYCGGGSSSARSLRALDNDTASLSIALGHDASGFRPAAPENHFYQAKRLVETLVFDLPFRALAFAQLRGALFFGAPETNPIFLRLGLGLGAPALLAVLVKVDDHRL
jgi:hypothetical protein